MAKDDTKFKDAIKCIDIQSQKKWANFLSNDIYPQCNRFEATV